MPFVSYAQNREDVLLWRVLKRDRGFYVDVGAADPVDLSVTKAFYDRGWRGLNVEPQPHYHAALTSDRPRDITLSVVCAAESGELTFYELPDRPGWSTTDADTAADLRGRGERMTERAVPAVTLAELCAEYAPPEGIDFLKIDVEGAEKTVLEGADFARFRPRVLVVEATGVGVQTPTHEAWEPLVLAADYRYAFFDGLNRYYVRSEDADLIPILAVPANSFDDYVPYEPERRADFAEKLAASRLELINAQEAHLRATETRAVNVEALAASRLDLLGRLEAHLAATEVRAEREERVAAAQRDRINDLEARVSRAAAGVPRAAYDALAATLIDVRAHLHAVRAAAYRAAVPAG